MVLAGRTVHAQTVGGVPDSVRYRFRLLGVYDGRSGDPLEGVDVVDLLSHTKGTTGKSGVLSLFYLPDGGSMVRVQKIGYEMQTFLVAISPTDTNPITITLQPATQLAPTVTTAQATPIGIRSIKMQSFEERRKSGFGTFVTDSVLRANESQNLANLLRSRLSGARVVSSKRGTVLLANRVGGAMCQVAVYMDNALLPAAQVNLDAILTSDVGGIEFYAGGAQLPVQFEHTGNGCGVLMIWTRDG